MRISPWVMILAAILLGGCSAPSKKQPPVSKTAPSTGLGGALPPSSPAPWDQAANLKGVNGMLAGQVIDSYERKGAKAVIMVVMAREDGQKAAPIEAQADGNGYFTIPGLDPGHSYQLIARVEDGKRVLSGATWARPPDPRLLIRVSEEFTNPATPPVPPLPKVPTERNGPERKPKVKSSDEPAASLDRPSTRPGPVASQPAQTPPSIPLPRSRPRTDLQMDIPYRSEGGSPIPPPPQVPEVAPAPPTAQPGSPVIPVAPLPTPRGTGASAVENPPAVSTSLSPVPSCVLVGRKLENFALYDVNGQAFDFRRDHKGRLVLLDFWHSQCGPCLRAIRHLTQLQDRYSAFGLEVIGIAYEQAVTPEQPLSPTEQARQVIAARGRYRINYRTLLGSNSDPRQPCPVQTQFNVRAFPTLKLIDQNGTIVWESEGLGDQQLLELDREIRRRLGIR